MPNMVIVSIHVVIWRFGKVVVVHKHKLQMTMMLPMHKAEDYHKANNSSIQMLIVEFIWLVCKSRNDNIEKKILPMCLIYNGKLSYIFYRRTILELVFLLFLSNPVPYAEQLLVFLGLLGCC